jgi:hypothetical protein
MTPVSLPAFYLLRPVHATDAVNYQARDIDRTGSVMGEGLHNLAEYVAEVIPGDLGVGLEVVERHSTTAGHIMHGWVKE